MEEGDFFDDFDDFDDFDLMSMDEDDEDHEDHATGHVYEGGCVDRDCPNQLSPIFQVRKQWKSEEVAILGLSTSGSSEAGTPVKNLRSDEPAIAEAARCTGIGAGTLHLSSPVHAVFTVLLVSPKQILSADHSKFVDRSHTFLAEEFCMTLDDKVGRAPWVPEEISFANLSKPLGVPSKDEDGEQMVDPMHGTLYALPLSPLSNPFADFNVWSLTSGSKKGRSKLTYISRFENFMFPASISYFWEQTRTCAMVMYPDVNSFHEGLKQHKKNVRDSKQEKDFEIRTAIEKDVEKFKREFWEGNSGMVLTELETSNLPEALPELRKLKRTLVAQLANLLSSTWAGTASGDCYVGVGRVLGYNLTTIAHSVSTLPGSSGAALIPTGTLKGIKRIFCGLQSGPAPEPCKPLFDHHFLQVRRPDHNIALSCDHPAFVSGYWINIVSSLPPPAKFSAKFLEETLGPFLHWIGLHLKLIVSCVEKKKWSDSQIKWLAQGVRHWLAERGGSKPEFSNRFVQQILSSPQILQQLVCSGYPAETQVENQIQYLRLSEDKNVFIRLEGWNMPGIVCSSTGDLARIASKLFADSLVEEQRYLKVPLHEFARCRLVQSGIEVYNTRVEVLVHAFALGFRSLFITSECGEGNFKEALEVTPVKRERIQVLVGAWTTRADLKLRISNMKCGYVDVLFVKLSELRDWKAELQASVDSGIVKSVGLQTDCLSELDEALNFFNLAVVQVNVSKGVIPVDILEKCEALNIGVVSTSDLWEMEADLREKATLRQLNVVWKIKGGVLPFTAVETREELSELHEVAIQPARFRFVSAMFD